jgi:hypothetical protein
MQSPSKLLKINGVACPCPIYGIEIIKSVVVDSGRNANGEVVGQKIGRTLYKLNNLEWRGLTVSEWDRIQSALNANGFFAKVTFVDTDNSTKTITMYPGDVTAKPLFAKNGEYTLFESCKFNLIDVGKVGEV